MKGKRNDRRKKDELKQLLEEAIENLVLRPYGGFNGLSITPDQYKWHLQQAWTSYSEHSLWIVQHFTVDISDETKSKILEFIKAELDPFIHEDKTLSAAAFVFNRDTGIIARNSSETDGDHLKRFLEQLLKITIFRGIEEAASDFEKCTTEIEGFFQAIILLMGITSETEIQVFDGIYLIPLSNSPWNLPRCWGGLPNPNLNFFEKMLLVIDYSVFPIFHNPFLPVTTEDKWDKWDMQKDRFRIEVKNGEFSNFNEADFQKQFCQALSLACNSAVQIDTVWVYISEDELFNINPDRSSVSFTRPSSAASKKIGMDEVDKAKCLYEKLVNLKSKVTGKLQIPIDRWIKSKTLKTAVEKIIDLGIVLEALYFPENKTDQLSLSLRLRASWHLGKDKEQRKTLMKELREIYNLRSKAVHTGKLAPTVNIGGNSTPTEKFIERSQDLCRDSILKILEEGEFPDWNDLILGEESM